MDTEPLVIQNDYDLLIWGMTYGHHNAVKYLNSKGVNSNKYLRMAAKNGHIEIVKLLIECCVNIHADDEYALELSAQNGHIEIVKLLIEHGADIHADNEYALRTAAQHGHFEIVKLLIEHGADIHEDNDSVLGIVADFGHIEIVKLLLEHGADIDADNYYALRVAACRGHLEIVEYLISKGANIEKEMYKGQINDQTETECGICLTEMNTKQKIVQCNVCKKCIHYECGLKWSGNCVYCRS